MAVFQPVTELILSYNESNLKRAAGIAGDKEIANPTKLASAFLLQNRLCDAQNWANVKAAAFTFLIFSLGAANRRFLKSTRKPKWSNYAVGVKLDFLKLIVKPKHYNMVSNNLT